MIKNGKKNMDFYRAAWESREHICEECGVGLREFSPAFISHIVAKNTLPSARYDLRNFCLLCFRCHQTYEFGNRKAMAIYNHCMEVKELLTREHYQK